MRVLLSGGRKTQNILDGINKKFNTTGDEFIIIEYLDDIMDIFNKGDYFDKALITEQSITRDGEITDNLDIRRRVSQFSSAIADRPSRHNFVFLASDSSIAEMIYDEILNIYDDSAIVLQSPPYGVNFFVRLIVTEAKELPSDWVFEPELAIPEQIEIPDNDSFTDMGEINSYEQLPEIPASDTFGDGFTGMEQTYNGEADGIAIETGESFDLNGTNNVDTFDDSYNTEFNPNNEFNGMNNSSFNEQAVDMYGNSFSEQNEGWQDNYSFNQDYNQPLETDYISPIAQSEELPDYNQSSENKISLEKNPVEQVDSSFIPGFDNDDSTNMYNNTDNYNVDSNNQDTNIGFDMYGNGQSQMDSFGQDMYDNNTQENGFDTSMYGAEEVQNDGFGSDMYSGTQSNDGFSQNMYSNVKQQAPQNDGFGSDMYGAESMDNHDNNINTGFEFGMYGNTDNDYMNNVNNDMYQNQSNIGNAAMAAGALGAMGAMASEMQQMNANNQMGRRKGLGAIFNRKKDNSNQYMEMAGQLNTPQPVQSWQQEQNMGMPMQQMNNMGPNINVIKEQLRPFATRGNSIVVTGCGGCGTSVVAYNLANIIYQLGYSVLLVDMDVEGRTQNYISKANYESMEPYGANLVSAVNSSGSSNAHESIVKQGFHLLTMGLSSDTAPVSDMLHKEKISRFINSVKSYHNFVIYDIPFHSAVGYLSDITYMSDNLVLVTDASNWGITKMMLSVCNIASDDMRETVFNRAQLVFNRQRNLKKVLGRKVRNGVDIAKVIDMKVKELIGEEPEFYFEDMHIAGIIEDDPAFEDYWFENNQYSDTKKGQVIFLKLLEHIVLKK